MIKTFLFSVAFVANLHCVSCARVSSRGHGAIHTQIVGNASDASHLPLLNFDDVPKYVISMTTESGFQRLNLMAHAINNMKSLSNLCVIQAINAKTCADQLPKCSKCAPSGVMAPAVGLSQAKAWKLAEELEGELDVIMIVEDDGFGHVPDNFLQLAQNALDARDTWDLFRLYYVPEIWHRRRDGQPPPVDFAKLDQSDWQMLDKASCTQFWQYGAALYFVTKRGARLLAEGYEADTMPVDMYTWFSNFNKLRVRCFNHPVMNFADVPSQHWASRLRLRSSNLTIPFCNQNSHYDGDCAW